MKWKYFLIDGEKFYSPKDIFERLKISMSTDHNWNIFPKNGFMDFQTEKCRGFNAFRKNLFYVETNMPKTNVFHIIHYTPEKSIADDYYKFGYTINSLVVFSNGLILAINVYSASNLPQNNPLEECAMVISKYGRVSPSCYKDIFVPKYYTRLVEGKDIPARKYPSSEGYGMYFSQISPSIKYYTSQWNDVAVKTGYA